MTRNLIRETLTTLPLKNLASGAGDPFGGTVDMSGWNGCLFTALATSAASTGLTTMTIYGATSSTATSTSDGFTIVSTGSIVSAPVTTGGSSSKGITQIDVIYPQQRYLVPRLTRATALAHSGVLAQRYESPRMVSSTKASTDALATAVLIHPQSTG